MRMSHCCLQAIRHSQKIVCISVVVRITVVTQRLQWFCKLVDVIYSMCRCLFICMEKVAPTVLFPGSVCRGYTSSGQCDHSSTNCFFHKLKATSLIEGKKYKSLYCSFKLNAIKLKHTSSMLNY